MNKFIVTTTISEPTEALRMFSRMYGWKLIVVGDKKTPQDTFNLNCTYLTPEMQEETDKELSDLIGWDCIQRRNFGFIYAWNEGADIVATVDDDNIPMDGWGDNLLLGEPQPVTCHITEAPVFDPLHVTNYPHLWHRGFPLELIYDRSECGAEMLTKRKFHVQADFWNGDPDIDAICRMLHNPQCNFDSKPFPFTSNAISPFNSQNTFLAREVLPHYFMFPGVGRFDDILAAYHVQHQGFKVVYGAPSVTQKRNPHHVMNDFQHELAGYQMALRAATNPALPYGIPDNSIKAFKRYQTHFK